MRFSGIETLSVIRSQPFKILIMDTFDAFQNATNRKKSTEELWDEI